MRLVMVDALSLRGEGLGNEVIGWAKGFLASRSLSAMLMGPAWGLNPRSYWRHFRTNRLDVIRNLLLQGVPHLRFTEADYRACGCTDFGTAVEVWAREKGLGTRRHLMVSVGGMYGGYRSVRRAALFLRSQLLASRNALINVERVSRLLDRKKIWVAVHVRLGDFDAQAQGDVRGRFNFRLPVAWYASACRAVREEFGSDVQFMFFSDQKTQEFVDLARQFDGIEMPPAALTECSDVILMSEADLRICSVSSYSLLACFLADGPYIWYEPQLLRQGERYRIWDDPLAIAGGACDTDGEQSGYAYSTGLRLPDTLVAQLRRRMGARDPTRNLIEYGSVTTNNEGDRRVI